MLSWFLTGRKMKMLLLSGILLHVSQHALGGVVEVNEGVESVLLRCQGSYAVPEVNPSVLWSRNDLNPKVIHLRREQGDDHKDQNQVYRRRTSMHLDALQTGDFDLTLRKPQLADSGNYTCSISDGRAELKLAQVQLKVKDNLVEVKVNEKAESVILPCKTTTGLKENTVVEWIRSDPDFKIVHVFSNTTEHNPKQDDLYCSRTEMNADLLRTGDLSLTLKFPTERDSGSYICTIYRDEDILRQTVVLHHVTEGPFPTRQQASGLFISVVLVLVIVGGSIFWYYFYPKFVQQVKVESGSESVLLRCWFPFYLFRDVRVEWTDSRGKKVYVYQKGLDSSNDQDKAYKGRTEMNKDWLKFGVFNLTIRFPLESDRNTYTCTVYNRKGKDLKKKRVMLDVKVLQVEVDSGAESVELPFKATADLPEKAKVEWRDQHNWTVHVFQNGSDHLHQQNWYYKGRTEMKKNAIKDKDLSLTVKHLTESDVYTCTVYDKEGEILLRKEVHLHVKVFEVDVEPGEESVRLPFQTPGRLNCEDIEVEWTNSNGRKVHQYCSSDQREDRFSCYANRTELNKDLMKTGDFSLTLKYPTDWDSDTYTCKVYGAAGTILMKKRVALHVKEHQVEMQDRNVQLPFRTTAELLEDCRVEWLQVEPKHRVIHEWKNRSDQPGGQTQAFRGKTSMKGNLIKTGDLSLTLENFTEDDSGKYKCIIYGKHERILQEKTFQVQMKGTVQVQNQPEDIRTSGSSVDPTPLMADRRLCLD